jgi:hypothetical protein
VPPLYPAAKPKIAYTVASGCRFRRWACLLLRMVIYHWHGTTLHNVSITSRTPDHLSAWVSTRWFRFGNGYGMVCCRESNLCTTQSRVRFHGNRRHDPPCRLRHSIQSGSSRRRAVLAAPASASASLAPVTARDLAAAAAGAELNRPCPERERAISKAARQTSRRSKTLAKQGELVALPKMQGLKVAAAKAAAKAATRRAAKAASAVRAEGGTSSGSSTDTSSPVPVESPTPVETRTPTDAPSTATPTTERWSTRQPFRSEAFSNNSVGTGLVTDRRKVMIPH